VGGLIINYPSTWLTIAGSLRRGTGAIMKILEFIKLLLALIIVLPLCFLIGIIILFDINLFGGSDYGKKY
jgi:hypothetical protein